MVCSLPFDIQLGITKNLTLEHAKAAQEAGFAISSSQKRRIAHCELWNTIFNNEYGRSRWYPDFKGSQEIDFVLLGSDLVYFYDDAIKKPERPLCLLFGTISRRGDGHFIHAPRPETIRHLTHDRIEHGAYFRSKNIILNWPGEPCYTATYLRFLGEKTTAVSFFMPAYSLHRDLAVRLQPSIQPVLTGRYGNYETQSSEKWSTCITWGPQSHVNYVMLEMTGYLSSNSTSF